MTKRAFSFTALDTLMFRDGRPFNQLDEGASVAVSVFPPPPPTLIGALRLALAERTGFNGRTGWPAEKLGDGVNWQSRDSQLGPMTFSAPLLARQVKKERPEILYPAPLHLAAAKCKGEDVFTFLLPRARYTTDQGEIYLASPPKNHDHVRPLHDHFLTARGMEAVLAGHPPDPGSVVSASSLWSAETRVGIGRNIGRRTANDGELYIASHTRLSDDISLVLAVDGLASDLELGIANQRLGGEHRAAEIAACDPVPLPSAPTALANQNGGYRYAALALSPVLFDEMPNIGGTVPGLPGTLQCTCTGKPQKLGGWDSQARQPIPMRPVLPAGSVFFMECNDEAAALAQHACHIGVATAWGFGQILIAKWELL